MPTSQSFESVPFIRISTVGKILKRQKKIKSVLIYPRAYQYYVRVLATPTIASSLPTTEWQTFSLSQSLQYCSFRQWFFIFHHPHCYCKRIQSLDHVNDIFSHLKRRSSLYERTDINAVLAIVFGRIGKWMRSRSRWKSFTKKTLEFLLVVNDYLFLFKKPGWIKDGLVIGINTEVRKGLIRDIEVPEEFIACDL